MFGSHKRRGAEAGLATRNSFAAVSMGTALFDFKAGFRPTAEFFKDPYVLGFYSMSLHLFRTYLFKGNAWSHKKSGEYQMAALGAFQGDTRAVDPETLIQNMLTVSRDPDFEVGKKDAASVFGAVFGMLRKDDPDPLVVQARAQAENFQKIGNPLENGPSDPDAGFKTAILWLTLKKELEERFPK